MEPKHEIRSFIRPAAWSSVLAWVLLAVMAVSIVMAAVAGSRDDTAEATLFDALYAEPGSYAYLDVVEISDWLYRNGDDVYYTAGDADAYYYTVRLSPSQYNDMAAQQAYWNRASDDMPMPEPYRLYGLAGNASDEIIENVASVWDMTADEYDMYFGSKFLNGTTTPAEEQSAIWFLVALFTFLFGLVFLLLAGRAGSLARRCLKRLDELGQVEAAGAELDAALANLSPDTCLSLLNGKLLMTEHFVFARRSGVAVPYTDIQWCFLRVQQAYAFITNTILVVYTHQIRNMPLLGAANKNADADAVEAAIARIREKNPETLFGFTVENRTEYKQRQRAMR